MLLLSLPVQAQEKSKLEKVVWITGASLTFSAFDYVGYSLTHHNQSSLMTYRIIQLGVQGGLTYLLYKECGLTSAISFNIIWWSWGDDWAYYGWAHLINPSGGRFENRSANGLQTDRISWASWTPLGLMKGGKGAILRQHELVKQSMIGITVAIIIL